MPHLGAFLQPLAEGGCGNGGNLTLGKRSRAGRCRLPGIAAVLSGNRSVWRSALDGLAPFPRWQNTGSPQRFSQRLENF